jgi:probable rRNA maturation factor
VSEIVIRNRQQTRSLNIPLLRSLTRHLLESEANVSNYEIGFHFVEPAEMARVNGQFLGHKGSTDVITFDYSEGDKARVSGEVFICMSEAVKQARQFRTTWQSEIVRYVIHSLLHLRGFDDLHPAKRAVMKREENRLLRAVKSRFKTQALSSARTSATANRKS